MRFLTGVAVWCRHFRGYEEVRTPAVKTAGLNAGERLVPVEEMEPWAQSAFKGFKYAASLHWLYKSSALLAKCLGTVNLNRRL